MFGRNSQQQQQGNIPVVQGVAVPGFGYGSQQHQAPPAAGPILGEDFNGVKGTPQPKKFQDIFFAILFYGHLVIMLLFLFGAMGSGGGNGGGGGGGGGGQGGWGGVITVVTVSGLFAVGLATFALGFMIQFSRALIKVALIFSVIMSLLMGLVGLMFGQIFMAVLCFISFAVGCCYAYFVWGRIPFAAANMETALTAVKSNLGLAIVAYLFLFLAIAWTVWWSVATGGAIQTMGNAAAFLFFLSYYWTHQVLQNTMHVTTAGVVGTWWFVPDEASSFCSQAIMDSFTRATTFSFGSICFGSLLVALVQALRQLNHQLRNNEELSFLVCIVDCILGCIESIIEYLNKWAYVYVGLYGYSYLEAGRNVITLFQNKGWTAIITDDLVDNVLFLMSVVIGLVTGLIGLLIVGVDRNIFNGIGAENPGVIGFLLGFLAGFLLASILMSVVGSAVNTVIVCFAESPAEFQRNHPQLSNEMRAAWRQAWPVECGNL